MRTALAIGLICALAGIGAGVGIGAAIWSGSPSASSEALRGRARPRAATTPSGLQTYPDEFTVIAEANSEFRPDYAPSNCAVPGAVTKKYDFGRRDWVYKGTAEINASGSCYFETSKAYWQVRYGFTSETYRFGLEHAGGGYGCLQNCGYDKHGFYAGPP